MDPRLRRIDELTWEIPQEPPMRVPARVYLSERLAVEPTALDQLRDAACLPPAVQVLATPDIHQGYGVPIGAVVACKDAVLPAAVGYDINCGMRLLATDLDRHAINLDALAHSIARDVPLGEGHSNVPLTRSQLDDVLENGLGAIPRLAESVNHRVWEAYDESEFGFDRARVERSGSLPGRVEYVPDSAISKGGQQLGTMGGGNHFIELQIVDRVFDAQLAERFGLKAGSVTIMIHSGSRRVGYEIAGESMRRAASKHHGPKDLAWIDADDPDFDRTIGAMHAGGNFAYVNRHIMMLLVRRCLRRMVPGARCELLYDVSHNMAQEEDHACGRVWVHRKGATRAFGPKRMAGGPFGDIGQPVIIPGSMGTGSYLLVGSDGSEKALGSVNHGAGRTMSRTAARGKTRHGKVLRAAAVTDEAFRRSMEGITLIAGDKQAVKEEAPAAYKDIDEVIDIVCRSGLAKRVVRLRPLAVLKG